MSVSDVSIIILLILLIPKLVEKQLAECGFAPEIIMVIVVGGTVWLFCAAVSEYMFRLVGLVLGSDGHIFETFARTRVIPRLELHKYGEVLSGMLKPGRSFYVGLQGILYYFTGATVMSVQVLNGFMAFWGGLVLTRVVYCFPYCSPKSGRLEDNEKPQGGVNHPCCSNHAAINFSER